MRKKYLVFIFGLTLVGCQLRTTSSALFDNLSCPPPCWQGVTPGITRKEDALAIFSKLALDGDSVSIRSDKSQNGYDDYILFSPSRKSDLTAGIFENRISIMKFLGYDGLSTKQAVELFGDPTYVFDVHATYYDEVVLINPKKGIAFGWSLDKGEYLEDSEFSPSTKVSLVYFFDPNQYERFLDSGILNIPLNKDEIKASLHLWKGYGSFDEKYWPPAVP